MSAIQSGQNYSANQINNWSRKDVGDFHNAASTPQGFTIKGKHYKYRVTIDQQGNAHVSVKVPKFTTKAQDRTAMAKARMLGQAVLDRTNHFTQLDKTGRDNAAPVFNKITKHLQRNQGNNPEVAVYGKGKRGELMDQFKAQGIKPVTIDKYNEKVGIGWFEAHPMLVPNLLTKLRGGSFATDLAKTPQTDVSEPRRIEWAKYLEKNVDRLDVLAKCKRLAGANDGGDSLAQFLVKNCPPDTLEPGLQAKIKNAPDRQSKLNLIKNTQAFKEVMKAAGDPNYKIPDNTPGLDLVFQNAFFRTTSKMGLEFFASQDVPVAFWTAKLGAETELGAMDPGQKQLKPWKNLDNRDVGGGNQRAESITYSEMRYVERLKTDLQGVQAKGRSQHMAPLAQNSLKVVPVLIKDLEGSTFVEKHTTNSPV